MRELEIYIHIPFCVRKCAYCDFLSAPASKHVRDSYVEILKNEICSGGPVCAWNRPETSGLVIENDSRLSGSKQSCSGMMGAAQLQETLEKKKAEYRVTSIFLGGGTPSLLTAAQIADILTAVRRRFWVSPDAEITIECNPGALGPQVFSGVHLPAIESGQKKASLQAEKAQMQAYLSCGINRISFGLQSADNRQLALLGRIHTWEDFQCSYEAARQAGFRNINVDLMSALPGQTVLSWEQTLRQVLELAPEHISAYSLIIEEGTPFYDRYQRDNERRAMGEQPEFLPSEEEERRMYERTDALLRAAGLFRYEISNYAHPGYACRHNIGYWRGCEYLGFGLGAASFVQCYAKESGRPCRVRLKNPTDLSEYEQAVQAQSTLEGRSVPECCHRQIVCGQCESLTSENEMEEFMFLGLRMTDGISEAEFARRFHCTIDSVYRDVLARLCSLGLLKRTCGRIFLSSRGIDVSNGVMAEFLL